jgi:hypothetical protein
VNLVVEFGVLAAVGLVTAALVSNIRGKKLVRKRTYQWYRTTYPKAFRGTRVTCCSCSCDYVSTRTAKHDLTRREHFCAQCGQSLYFTL